MSELRKAIEANDAPTVWRLLDERGDANLPLEGDGGLTPLHLAARLGLQPMVYALLIVYEADIHARDAQGLTALHHAAAGGHPGVVRYLLDQGAHLGRSCPAGRTPMRMALEAGQEDVVELLLCRRVGPDAPDSAGNTLLHEAARRGWAGVVQALLERDAEPGGSSHVPEPRLHEARNADGDTPLHLAVRASQAQVAALLVAGGADVWAVNDAGEKPIVVARSRGDEDLKTAIQCGAGRRTASSPYWFSRSDGDA